MILYIAYCSSLPTSFYSSTKRNFLKFWKKPVTVLDLGPLTKFQMDPGRSGGKLYKQLAVEPWFEIILVKVLAVICYHDNIVILFASLPHVMYFSHPSFWDQRQHTETDRKSEEAAHWLCTYSWSEYANEEQAAHSAGGHTLVKITGFPQSSWESICQLNIHTQSWLEVTCVSVCICAASLYIVKGHLLTVQDSRGHHVH